MEKPVTKDDNIRKQDGKLEIGFKDSQNGIDMSVKAGDELGPKIEVLVVSQSQKNRIDELISNYNSCCSKIEDPLPSSPLFDSFLEEFVRMGPEEVVKLAEVNLPLLTEQQAIDTMNNYKHHEDTFLYNEHDKDLQFLFKRLYACYYKQINKDEWGIDWSDFKGQIAKDVNRNEVVLFDNDTKTLSEQNPKMNSSPIDEQGLMDDYYGYICKQIVSRNIKTRMFEQLDLINICVMTIAQTFKATYFKEFSLAGISYFSFMDAPYFFEKIHKYNFFCFLYGYKQNTTNYDTANNTIIYDMFQNIMNFNNIDDNGFGVRLVNIKFIANLNENTAQLKLIFYQSFCLYRYGVYIGELFVDNDNNYIMNADGKGILYIYDYNSDKKETTYPTAKISGTFSKGFLKAGTMVDIVFYSDEADFDKKTFNINGKKEDGVISALDINQIGNGNITIPGDINLNDINDVYLSTLVAPYNTINAQRKNTVDVNNAINTGNYLKLRSGSSRFTSKSNKGIIWFEPDIAGRQYFYEGPFIPDSKNPNILYISQKFGTIKQLIADNKSKTYIPANEQNRKNWFEFVLTAHLSDYKTIGDLPLKWTQYNLNSYIDMLKQSAVAGFFTKELLETIGKTNNIDNALFSDNDRLIKILEILYIESIAYISAFVLMLKKYQELAINANTKKVIDKVLSNFAINDNDSNLNKFINFNPDISAKYFITELTKKDEEKEEEKGELEAYFYAQSLILPILASLTPETENLLAPIVIDATNIDNTILILNKNLIIVMYMLSIVTAKLGDKLLHESSNELLPGYDPLIITLMLNLFKDSYDSLSIESKSKDIIDNNSDEIFSILLRLALIIDKKPNLLDGGSNKNKSNKNKSNKKRTTKKKHISRKLIRNMKKITRKIRRVKFRRYTRRPNK